MITLEQLAAIKANRDKLKAYSVSSSIVLNMQADIDTMLAELDRLHLALQAKDGDRDAIIAGFETRIESYKDIVKAKDAVLAQFSDKENWEVLNDHLEEVEGIDMPDVYYMWRQVSNPIDLAERAMLAESD